MCAAQRRTGLTWFLFFSEGLDAQSTFNFLYIYFFLGGGGRIFSPSSFLVLPDQEDKMHRCPHRRRTRRSVRFGFSRQTRGQNMQPGAPAVILALCSVQFKRVPTVTLALCSVQGATYGHVSFMFSSVQDGTCGHLSFMFSSSAFTLALCYQFSSSVVTLALCSVQFKCGHLSFMFSSVQVRSPYLYVQFSSRWYLQSP